MATGDGWVEGNDAGDGTDSGSTANGDGGSVVAGEGLPCDVQAVLSANCDSCHGSPLAGGAPIALLTRDQLLAPSTVDASARVIDRVIARATDPMRPMPPTGLLGAADVQTLQNWVNAGTPAGTCTGSTEPPPLVCTSGTYWTSGNTGSPSMNPGLACVSCHQSEFDAPILAIAGTVYPTVREPDRCRGAGGTAVTVEITDANGGVHTLHPNAAGNFYTPDGVTIPFPIKARVLANGKTRAMVSSQMSGDCNSCHTQDGAQGAPGRVYLP